MGHWATMPLEAGTWYRMGSTSEFKKVFGIPKGLLTIYGGDIKHTHQYIPELFLQRLHKRIDKINKSNYKNLEKKLKRIYPLRVRAMRSVPSIYHNVKHLTNHEIASAFIKIRQWVHKVTIFDQFGWLAEEYWTPKMKAVLEDQCALKYGTDGYNRVLFALTKPENISTTLSEKKAVLEELKKIKSKKSTLDISSAQLAKRFGWLPVFTYGEPWGLKHYEEELRGLLRLPLKRIEQELKELRNYKKIRNTDIATLVKKYNISGKELQVFIDFGLAIDSRNEAEYFVSFAGFFLMPLFNEAAKRLFLSPQQLRMLTDEEFCSMLRGEISVNDFPYLNATFRGWGFNRQMTWMQDFTPEEAEKLFYFVESYVKPVQGDDSGKGICASPGKATGKVRIVPSPEQNHKVKNGDILFTYATTTDYLPAMKRAAAIITEVGGLTCHAAVVSREFNIPCIVALKNAMNKYKDGDMVEVDANKGIVKKL